MKTLTWFLINEVEEVFFDSEYDPSEDPEAFYLSFFNGRFNLFVRGEVV